MHGHTHHAGRRALLIALALNGGFFVVEAIGGWMAHSLAAVADAGHMLSDAAALALALIAARLAARRPSARNTFGLQRAEILAALVNGLALVAIAIFVVVEAMRRIGSSPDVAGAPVLVLGVAGLGVNLISALLLHRGGDGLNLRAAGMHMRADAFGSVATIISGVAVLTAGWRWVDAIAGFVIALPIAWSAWGLVREATAILLESAPSHLELDAVRHAMTSYPGVVDVHDMHVWTLTSGSVALSAHVVAPDATSAQTLITPLRKLVHDSFGIHHATLQVEVPGADCADCEAHEH